MLVRRSVLKATALGLAAVAPPLSPARAETSAPAATGLANARFRAAIDPATGGLLSLVDPNDPAAMSWIAGPDNAPWQPLGSLWGLGFADLGDALLHRGRWGRPVDLSHDPQTGWTATYRVGPLQVTVSRRLEGVRFKERYSFTNTGQKTLTLRASGPQALGIYTPFNDSYTSTADVLEHRCHAHIWTGGACTWIAGFRMGGRGPHLGLVVTEGGFDGYSIEDRDTVTLSNTRGTILLHPQVPDLQPGESHSLAWTMFWHAGWDDFFAQGLAASAQMIRIEASSWSAMPGEPTALTFAGALGVAPVLTSSAQTIPLRREARLWRAELPPRAPGETTAHLAYGDSYKAKIALNATPDLDALMAARARFIVERQQWTKPGDAWDGAYIVYDNQLEAMVRTDKNSDRNNGRERLGMGVFLARWLRQSGSTDPALRASLDRYYRFVCTQLQRPDGYVLDGSGRERKRLYNWPWVMQMHLEMARLTANLDAYDRFMATLESYYREGGSSFYPIGLPVLDGLKALKAANRPADHARAGALFAGHGEAIIGRGTNYPASEVNYEQSIVAPAAIVLLELGLATGESKWLEAAKPHVALLDLFEGRQPDHRLNGVAIRHWDGYWFGKLRLWGDTFPHYWSSLNALAWAYMAKATGDSDWETRARTTLRGNLSLFTADGRGSAAFVYPTSVNGQVAHVADPYANDQDWAFVHALQLRELAGERSAARRS